MNRIFIAFITALVVCLTSMYVNYRAYQETRSLEYAIRRDGGEITVEFAPGWRAVHLYAMTPDQKSSHQLDFSPVSLAGSVLAGTGAVYAALVLVEKLQ